MLIDTIKNSIILISLSIIGFLYVNNTIKDKSLKQCQSELQTMQKNVQIFENDAKTLKEVQEKQAEEINKNRKHITIKDQSIEEVKKQYHKLIKDNEKDSF